jgi:hypothetical protein
MRKLIILSAFAILALGASSVLAISLQETFSVTGHLAVTTTTSKCTSLPYPAMCPSGDNCVCYSATKTSLHTATGSAITIPPGTTQVAVSVDNTENTSHPGCKPAWGEVQYTQTGGSDTTTVEFFASLCSPLGATLPLTFSGGGALTNATLDFDGFQLSGITGLGTATGTYFPAAGGTNLTLNLTAVIAP